MTMWDFFYQAGVWQWIGLFILAGIFGSYAASAISGCTLFAKSKTINHYHTETKD